MHLVDGKGRFVGLPRPPACRPPAVAGRVPARWIGGRHHRRGGRADLHGAPTGIGLVPGHPVGAEDAVLVAGSRPETGKEELPHPGVAPGAHGVAPGVPSVHVAHEPHGPGVGSPEGEQGPLDPLDDPGVGAKDLVDAEFAPFEKGPNPGLVHPRGEAVGILDLEDPSLRVFHLEAVGEDPGGVHLEPEGSTGPCRLHGEGGRIPVVLPENPDRPRPGEENPDDPPVTRLGEGVDSQDVEGGVKVPGFQGGDRRGGEGVHEVGERGEGREGKPEGCRVETGEPRWAG